MRATPCQLLCLSKKNLAQLRIEVDQTCAPSCTRESQSSEVYHINICFTFVHKHRCANQEHEVTSYCAISVVLNLHIIVYNIRFPLHMTIIKSFQKAKLCMITSMRVASSDALPGSTPNKVTIRSTPSSRPILLWSSNFPLMGRCKRQEISSKVIVITPIGR